jgi:8-oxo-dGTP diphosphatase
MFPFNVRVYGILINDDKQVLVSDELIKGNYYTKFPGGGLEFGEGTRQCLQREFKEELNLIVSIEDHLYTTDFFQLSAFHPGHQVISIYYLVKALEPITQRLGEQAFEFDDDQMVIYNQKKEIETFRFVDWDNLNEESCTLPIDKVVVQLLKQKF